MKTCSRCKQEKATSEFNRSGDGFQAWCRECMKEYQRKKVNEDQNALYVMSYESSLSGPYKIGRTSCVEARVAQLEASQCFRIVVHAAFPHKGDIEKKIHEQLAAFQVIGYRGKEWFNCPLSTIITAIASHF